MLRIPVAYIIIISFVLPYSTIHLIKAYVIYYIIADFSVGISLVKILIAFYPVKFY